MCLDIIMMKLLFDFRWLIFEIFTGELGWELYVNNDRAVDLYNQIMNAGEEFNIGYIGGYAINSMRIEKGFRMWGAEVCCFRIFVILESFIPR